MHVVVGCAAQRLLAARLPTATKRQWLAGRGAHRPQPLCSSRRSSSDADSDPQDEPRQLYGDFVRAPTAAPLPEERTRACSRCSGDGAVACGVCGGSGRLARGGYHKKNPMNLDKLQGSKWTAMERTFGWRHFRCAQRRKEGKDTYALLVATCDEETRLWVNARNLKDRERWAAGWLQKAELQGLQASGPSCKRCGGSGQLPCPLCSRGGQVVQL